MLDKNRRVRTVVCEKVGSKPTKYGYLKKECCAGVKNFKATLVEDKVKFEINLAKMHWNSKFQFERTRIIDKFLSDDKEVICDLFCGAGAFSVRAAVKRKDLKVVANDFNSKAIKYCTKNIKLNEVTGRVITFN